MGGGGKGKAIHKADPKTAKPRCIASRRRIGSQNANPERSDRGGRRPMVCVAPVECGYDDIRAQDTGTHARS